MEENIIDLYTDKVMEAKNPALELNKMYHALFEIPYSHEALWMFTKTVKIYGRQRVLYALIEASGMDKVTHDKFYGLLQYFLKREYNKAVQPVVELDTTDVRKLIKKPNKLKVKELFDE